MNKGVKYRPDIDGLRGIAVLLVFFYHFEKVFLKSTFLQGGFIGVDIFFVVSGYLISYLIFNELKNTNNFSYKNFYLRRIKRILPVLALVIFFSTIISYILFIPEKFIFSKNSAISSWFFLSNIFFWKRLSTYHAEESTNLPLLHTWSLAVEEQFYIFFPILIFLIFIYFKKGILFSIISVIIVSILTSTFASFTYPNANFYLLPSRVWEILFGSLIAYFQVFKDKKFYLTIYSKLLILISLILIILFSFLANDQTYHPSFLTLIPVLSTVCLICFCEEKNFFVNKFLASKILVYFGLISYSLYLWHYPIFVFTKKLNLADNNLINFTTIVLVFIISALTYKFIEKPIRKGKYNLRNLIVFVIIFSVSIIYLNFKNFDNFVYVDKISPNITKAINKSKSEIDCIDKISEDFCFMGKNDFPNQIDIVLLGDSVLNSLANNLKKNISDKKYRIVNLSQGGSFYTPYGRYINLKSAKDRVSENQDLVRSKYLSDDKSKKIIIIGAKYRQHLKDFTYIYRQNSAKQLSPYDLFMNKTKYFSRGINDAKEDFKKTLNDLLKKNQVILIYPFPEFPDNYLQTSHVKNLLIEYGFSPSKLELMSKDFFELNKDLIKLLDSVKHENLFRVYPQSIFCKNSNCFFEQYGRPLYSDQIHLTNTGAQLVNEKILKIISKIN